MVVLAGAIDLRHRRIPNWLTLGSAGVALAYHGGSGGSKGLMLSVFGWVLGAAAFFLPFALGGSAPATSSWSLPSERGWALKMPSGLRYARE